MHACEYTSYDYAYLLYTYDCCTYLHKYISSYSLENIIVTTPFAGITILQGDDVTLSCVPSQSDVALQWSFDNGEVSSSPNHQFAPPFLNHDLTITNANDTDSGSYVCAFKLRNRIIDQKIIVLTVVPSEFVCMHSLCHDFIVNLFLLFISLFAKFFWWIVMAYKQA